MRTRTLLLFSLILMMVAVSEIGVGFWPWENSAEAQLAPKGSVVGRLEIYPGVPITECFIKTVGDISDVPEGKCDESGLFYITPISTGVRRELIIENASGQVIKRIHTAVNPGFTTDLGTIVVFDPGMVTGRIIGADAAHLARLVVTVAGFPLATKPDAYGYYLLTNVPEGERKLVLHGIWWEHSRAQLPPTGAETYRPKP